MLRILTKNISNQIKHTKLPIACFSTHNNRLNQLNSPRVLITGGLGQIGVGLAKILREKYGKDNIILSDVKKASKDLTKSGPYVYADVLDFKGLQEIVVNNDIDWVIHMSAILSAVGENNVPLALRINIEGVHNVLELAKQHKLRIFIPSTIGAFGSETPQFPSTPDVTIQKPKTIYGVSKVHMELLGDYYNHKYNLDFRCLRLPSIVSAINPGLGGTAVYAVEIFHHAVKKGSYECYLKPDTRLPMMYIDDCIDSIVNFVEQPIENVKQRVYNVQACSFTPGELADEIKKHMPELNVSYKIDSRQLIADKWPKIMDDSNARRDWNHKHKFDLPQLVETMLREVKQLYKQ